VALREQRDQPWWTTADQAELDLLVHELVRVGFVHRARCTVCGGGRWCPAMHEALDVLLEWREGRVLRSKAAWLRARESEAA
jgi:1,6-anhydro-N-acetylmuramate kinase